MPAVFINNYATTTTSALSSSDTSVSVADALPALTGSNYYLLTFFYVDNGVETNREIVKVTAVGSNNTLTIARGQENTNSYAWAAGSRVELRVTSAPLNDLTAKKVDKDSDTGAVLLPSGTTAQRPADGQAKLRFNTDLAKFEGHNGSAWGSLGGATGGGNDAVFYTNGQTVTANYTVPSGQNAMSAGPITIADGVTVTISDGSVWTIV
jgi:hypothetical protein